MCLFIHVAFFLYISFDQCIVNEIWDAKKKKLMSLAMITVQAHPADAVNVQIYRLIKEWTAWDIARRAAFAFFGIFSGTEENPEFIKCKMNLPHLGHFLNSCISCFLKLNF